MRYLSLCPAVDWYFVNGPFEGEKKYLVMPVAAWGVLGPGGDNVVALVAGVNRDNTNAPRVELVMPPTGEDVQLMHRSRMSPAMVKYIADTN